MYTESNIVTSAELDAAEQVLNDREIQARAIANRSIPMRQYGVGITPQMQQDVLQQKYQAEETLKRIATERNTILQAREQIAANERIREAYERGASGEPFNPFLYSNKEQQRAYAAGYADYKNKIAGTAIKEEGAPTEKVVYTDALGQPISIAPEIAEERMREYYKGKQSIAPGVQGYKDIKAYLESGGVDIKGETVAGKVEKGITKDLNKYFGVLGPKESLKSFLGDTYLTEPLGKQVIKGSLAAVGDIAVGAVAGAEILSDPTLLRQKNALRDFNKFMSSPKLAGEYFIAQGKQIVQEPISNSIRFVVGNYLVGKLIEPGVKFLKEPTIVAKEVPEPTFRSSALVRAFQQEDILKTIGEFNIIGERAPGVIATVPRGSFFIPIRPTNPLFLPGIEFTTIPPAVGLIRQEPFIVEGQQVIGSVENPSRPPVSLIGTRTRRTRTGLFSYEALMGEEIDLSRANVKSLSANIRKSIKDIETYKLSEGLTREFTKGTKLTTGETILTEKPIFSQGGLSFKYRPKISRFEITSLKAPESVLIEYDKNFGLLEKAKYKELISGVDVTFPQVPKVKMFNIREFTSGGFRVREIRTFKYPEITERTLRKNVLIQGETETRYFNLPSAKTDTNIRRFIKQTSEGETKQLLELKTASPELKRAAIKTQDIIRSQIVGGAEKLSGRLSRVTITQTMKAPILEGGKYAGLGLYERTEDAVSQIPREQAKELSFTGTTIKSPTEIKFISVPKETNREVSRVVNRELNREVNREVNRELNREISREILKMEPRLVQRQISRTVQRTVQRQVPREPGPPEIPLVPRIPRAPIRPNAPTTNTVDKIFNSFLQGFRTFIIKRRKKVYLPGVRTKGEALQFGELTVENTLAATFGVEPTNKAVKGLSFNYFPSMKIFRSYRYRKGKRIPLKDIFVQRTTQESGLPGGRLEFPGERRAIKAARSFRL